MKRIIIGADLIRHSDPMSL